MAAGFAEAARNAHDSGFDAVELHGVYGHLLDEFLWERTNQRTDGCGGSIAAGTRVPVEAITAAREAVGSEFPIIYRLSQWKDSVYDAYSSPLIRPSWRRC